jgi:hypothetical protein
MILPLNEVQATQTLLNTYRSHRARIIQGMVELMKTVTSSRNYSFDLVTVTTDAFPWEDATVGQTPAMWIQDLQTDVVNHAGCIREYTMTLALYLVCREMDLVAFEECIADIELAIGDNNSLYGQVNLMRVPQVNTDSQYFKRLDGTHVAQLIVQAVYTRKFNQPK